MTEHPLAVVRTTDDLRAILRARFTELGVSLETVDYVAGLPTRYTAKLLGLQPSKSFGPISFEALLGAAGLKLLVLEDAEALDRVRTRLVPLQRIDSSGARRRRVIIKFRHEFMREIGKLGGQKSYANALRRKAISEARRQAALKRWQKPEATESPAVTAP